MSDKYDVIVIGAGPGGMTAALYASRANLKVAMLDRGVYGGQMNNTAEVENYPGFKSILGPDLAEEMFQSSTQFGAEFVYGNVEDLTVDDNGIKHVKTDDGELEAPVVIIATGSQYRKLGVPGEEKYSMLDFGNQELETIEELEKLPCYSSETFVTKTDIKENVIFDMELHSVSIIADMYKIPLISMKKISDNLNMDDYYKNIETENIMELESSVFYIEKYIK